MSLLQLLLCFLMVLFNLNSVAKAYSYLKAEDEKEIGTDYVYHEGDDIKYRFNSMNDINAQKYFYKNGYVVITNIFENEKEIDHAHELLWNYLSTFEWVKNKASTYNIFPGWDVTGIIYQGSIGQSELQWFIRTRPKLLSTFQTLWNLTETKQLITSYDGIGIFRPWKYNKKWETFDQWYHIDQNIVIKPGLDAVQGLLSLTDQNNLTGSTVVIPQSHLFTPTYLSHTMTENDGNFQLIEEENLEILLKSPHNLYPLILSTKTGDLLLWDSRVIHCSIPSLEISNNNNQDNNNNNMELLRIVSYVCMTPKSKASPEIIKKRISGFESHSTSNHNPHDPNMYGKYDLIPEIHQYSKLDINLIRSLVGYSETENHQSHNEL